MADKEKMTAQNSDVEKATTEESNAAAKVAKAAKGSKNKKPGLLARANKGSKRFFKDFKGECKKIVWPDAKTVLKSTGIVLLVVTIVTLIVFAIDFGLEQGISGLKTLAKGETSQVTSGNVEETEESDDVTEAEAEENTEDKAEDEKAE